MSSEISLAGSAPRQKQSLQLQRSGAEGIESLASPAGNSQLQQTETSSAALAKHPPKIHWNGHITTNAVSKIEMYCALSKEESREV